MRVILIGPLATRLKRSDLPGATPIPGAMKGERDGGAGREARPCVIAVDGGLSRCERLKFAPDVALGDWDGYSGSLSAWKRKGVRVLSYPADKDRSDLSLAFLEIERILKNRVLKGREERDVSVELHGFLDGRKDHELAVWFEAHAFLKRLSAFRDPRIALIGPTADAYFVRLDPKMRPLTLKAKKSSVFSLFAWGGAAEGVRLTGALYALRGERLIPGSRGLSNRFNAPAISIRGAKGELLAVLPKKPFRKKRKTR